VSWKKDEKYVKNESKEPDGRFSIGTPRVSDGQLLFLQHMISKMEPSGSRIGVVFNGSPMFTGDSGSGESEIRKWIIENDWLETIVQLPDRMFFNTGITTYLWIVTNKKSSNRKGKIQLINGSKNFQSTKKNLGQKGKKISSENIDQILTTYINFKENENCKIFENKYFGYTKVQIEQPLIENEKVIKLKSGKPKPDTKLRDYEKIPLSESIDDYFENEVKQHLPDSWMDRSKDKVGYEINLTKYFFEYKPLRSSEDISHDLSELIEESEKLLNLIMERS
jgi:type I restriction enzyme M protein